MAGPGAAPAEGPGHSQPPGGDLPAGTAGAGAEGVRLHLGGCQGRHPAHGPNGGGAHRRHGGGYSPGGAGPPGPAAVRLFPPALRPGDQPAHRRHPGGDRHRHRSVCGG